jgi:alkanesulfonate monooxygenase SsuD/methylene tetrahydromethanopterin reductase-like flavin-dependent oxidoreductase (luciferase family)
MTREGGVRLALMLAGGGGTSLRQLAALAKDAEDAGLAGVYLAEAWRSGYVPVAALAAATSRIEVGPYVLNAHARSPLFAGIGAVDLDEFTGGRLVLGVGSGNEVTNARYQGIPVRRPLRKMRDYVEVLRRVTTARAGQRVDYAGDVHATDGWYCQVDPVRDGIPIVLAATSPRMTGLAAEVADGVALGSLLSGAYVADIAAACRAASPRPDFRVMMTAFASVDEDRDRARRDARRAVVNLYAGKPHPHYDRLLRQQGFATVADRLGDLTAQGRTDEAHRAVPDEVVDSLTVAGTPDDCRTRLADYPGLNDLILVNVNGMRYRTDPRPAGEVGTGLLDSYRPLLAFARQMIVVPPG